MLVACVGGKKASWWNGAATVSADSPEGAIEVVLHQTGAKIECKVTWVNGDTTDYDLGPLSWHQAKRQMKASLARDGYVPVDRWSPAGADGHRIMRHFARPPANDRLLPLER
jgi:hypothetical protein